MGPFPHDAPPACISADNPMGTDGFAFVEFAHPQPEALHALFRLLGFAPVAHHRTRLVTVYRQGDVDYIVNEDPDSRAAAFAASHGPCAPSMGFRVVDASHAYRRAVELGAQPADGPGRPTLDVPALQGIGGSALYLVDRYGAKGSVYDADFVWTGERDPHPPGTGLFHIDHLTHNVGRGRMDHWAGFYQRMFNFREIRYFDIKGEYTGLYSRALTSPDGRIRIPINESADDNSQIEEFLRAYKGEGIQHIACGCRDIHAIGRMRCARPAWPSCHPHPRPITNASTNACPATARTSPVCNATASCSTAPARMRSGPARTACCCRSSPPP